MTPPRLDFRLLKVGHCTHPECVAMRGGRWASMLFPALCGLLRHPSRGWILFDTGYSNHFLEATNRFPERMYRWITPLTLAPEETLLAQLAASGIAAGDIRYVVISHMHGDHIAGLRDFPNAQFVIMRAEHEAMRGKSRLNGLLHAFLPALIPDDFAQRMVCVEDTAESALSPECRPFERGYDIFGDRSILAVPLPGHSHGQLGIVFRRSDDRQTFMVGDACWSNLSLQQDRPPTWLARRIIDHSVNYAQTFHRLQQLTAHAQSPQLIPSHCIQTWNNYSNEHR
jgi:glyoxylase-like metal-dependent hydrolase (beta-lactamase superfamily II)